MHACLILGWCVDTCCWGFVLLCALTLLVVNSCVNIGLWGCILFVCLQLC